jgi:hypothetical protein
MRKPPIHRFWVTKKTRRDRQARQDVLPLDPRDPEVVRAKVSRKKS